MWKLWSVRKSDGIKEFACKYRNIRTKHCNCADAVCATVCTAFCIVFGVFPLFFHGAFKKVQYGKWMRTNWKVWHTKIAIVKIPKLTVDFSLWAILHIALGTAKVLNTYVNILALSLAHSRHFDSTFRC